MYRNFSKIATYEYMNKIVKELKMKKGISAVIITLFLIILAPSLRTYASDTPEHPIYKCKLNSDGTTVTITGFRDDYSENVIGPIIPSSIGGKTVTAIDVAAFDGNIQIQGSITFPSTLNEIGHYAFRNCTELTGNLTIPDSVTTLGMGAFKGCEGFDGDLSIGDSVTEVLDSTFEGCGGFEGNLVIGSSVSSIADNAFNACKFSGDLTIPGNVKTIGENAFYGCSFGGDLTIDNGVISIGNNAFFNCGFTGNLSIGNSVTTIGDSAFEETGWDHFQGTLILGNSISQIGGGAFSRNEFNGDLVVPQSMTKIGRYAFSHCSFTGKLVLPDNLTEIDEYAFTDSKFTGDLIIPRKVKSIGWKAFGECEFTGSLTISESVTNIEGDAFAGCYKFKGTLTIPKTVSDIGDDCFTGCTGFTSIINNSSKSFSTTDFLEDDDNCFKDNLGNYVFYNGGQIRTGIYTRVTAVVHVSRLELDKTTITINKGESVTLNAKIVPSQALDKQLTWSSKNATIASVDRNGVVKGLKSGTTEITVKSNDRNKETVCIVTVYEPDIAVTGVTINLNSLTVYTGKTQQLTAAVFPSNATNQKLTWTSSNTNVATVKNGLVSGIKSGTAVITVTSTNGKKATCKITVSPNPVKVTKIKLNKKSASIMKGKTLTLKATISPANATNKNVTWKSSNKKVATVKNGVVTAVAKGTATITVTTKDGGKTATCKITVKNPIAVKSVKLNKSKASLEKGKTLALKATIAPSNAANKNVTWKSSNKSVATVDKSGVVKAVKKGTATIKVTTSDGSKTASCKITVTDPVKVKNIKFDKKSYTVKKGKTLTLEPIIAPKNATNKEVTYKSSNAKVASIDKNGKVRGLKKGKVTITVTTKDGKKKATCQVIVK